MGINLKKAPEWDLAEAKHIVLSMLKNNPSNVYLFGSRAVGKMTPYSDIDIAILPKNKLPQGLLAEIRDVLENSEIIYKVDLVDLSETSESFTNRVLNQGIPWKD